MQTGIITKQDNNELFIKYWHTFIHDNSVSPLYIMKNIEYLLKYSNKLYKDLSFVYIKDNKPVACAFLPIEKDAQIKSISICGGYVPAPFFLTQYTSEKIVMDTIDNIVKQEKISKVMFCIDPLEFDRFPYNFLVKYNYLDTSLVSYILNCKESAMRRNHLRAIKKISKDKSFSLHIMDKDNSDYTIHEIYRKLHHKCAGRITRPIETYDLQFDMLKHGNAVLVGLKLKNKFIAFTYFMHHCDKAISFSASDDPDYDHLPLYHIINDAAIKYLENIGVRHVDTGQPFTPFAQFLYYPDEKQRNISLFKTGFSGRFVQSFQGIKYFAKNIFEQDVEDFVKNYKDTIYE